MGKLRTEPHCSLEANGRRVAIVGTGALGSTLLEYLCDRDVRSVLLIDPDRLEPRNLALSSFFQEATQPGDTTRLDGLPEALPNKAELLADYVTRRYGLPAHAAVAEIADVGWQDLFDVDEFYCCTDSALSRVEMTYIARILAKRMVDGGVLGHAIHEGRVSDFSPSPEAACYLCGMGEESRAAVLGYAASAALGCRIPDDAPAMTGTIQSIRTVAYMLSRSFLATEQDAPNASRAVKIRVENATSESSQLQLQQISLKRSATCPWHDGLPGKLEVLPWEEPLRTSMPSRELQLAWPICTEAVCAACGFRSQPFLRVARVRRTTTCFNCGERKLQPVRAVHRIWADDPLGERSPRQLGQPDRHLYWLRDTIAMNGRREGAR